MRRNVIKPEIQTVGFWRENIALRGFKRSQNDTSAGSFAGGVTIPGMRGYHKTEWGVTMLRCIHIRVIDFPSEGDAIRNLSKEEAGKHFKSMGGEDASKAGNGAPHPLMHRTSTVDYGIVLEGEMILIVDQVEVAIKAGDIIIQRGTNHAWSNRSGKSCRMAFILIDGEFTHEVL